MNTFAKTNVTVDGTRIQLLEAGRGDPIVFLHGAGTGVGFESLLPLAKNNRVIVPVHPGFGESDDDPRIDSVLDYVVHYDTLFDQIGLTEPFGLAGHSLGGWIASLFAILKGHRVRRLALTCPAGLRVPEHPTLDLFTIPADNLPSVLVFNQEILARMTSANVTIDMKVGRYREMTTLARIAWDRNYEPKLGHWLPKVKCPTLIMWGEQDRAIPIGQAEMWAKLIPNSEVVRFPDAGHLLLPEAPRAIETLGVFFDSSRDRPKETS